MPGNPILLRSAGLLNVSPRIKPTGGVTIDWNRAPRGLKVFFLNNDDQHFGNLATGQASTTTSTGQLPIVAPTAFGSAFSTITGVSAANYVSTPFPFPQDQCSAEALIIPKALPAATQGLLSFNDNTPGSGTFDKILYIDAAGKPNWSIYDGNTRVATGTALSVGTVVHLVGVSTLTGITIYQNGVQTGTGVATGASYTGYANPQFVQGYSNNGDCQSYIIYAAFANTAWNAAEVLDRYLNPYDFLIPSDNYMQVPFLPFVAPTFRPAPRRIANWIGRPF